MERFQFNYTVARKLLNITSYISYWLRGFEIHIGYWL